MPPSLLSKLLGTGRKKQVESGPSAYEQSPNDNNAAGEDPDQKTEVRSTAARQCVRQLRMHPVLSQPWLTLVDSLEQLSRLAQLESLMPSVEDGVSDQVGRVKDSDGTLWDQEAKEVGGYDVAIRVSFCFDW